MGCIRTFFAIVVVISHSWTFVFVGPILAVQSFFLISGFLISFVLTEAGSYDTMRSFYVNRVLRLYPVYLVVALATLAMLAAVALVLGNPPPAFETFATIDTAGKTALVLSNLLLFGQDWIFFTAVEAGRFGFAADFTDTELVVWRGLLIPPAWTLGIELSFYLIAPLVLPRLRLIIALLAASLALRVAIITFGPGFDDPWNYRFFPTELAFFLIGALSHQLWRPWLAKSGFLSYRSAVSVTVATFVFAIGFTLIPSRPVATIAFLAFVALALPFLFEFQRRMRWDRWIGELSYPIYIVHWSVLYPVSYVWDRMAGEIGYQGLDETLCVLALSLAASLVLKRHVADRFEGVRRRVKSRKDASPALAHRMAASPSPPAHR